MIWLTKRCHTQLCDMDRGSIKGCFLLKPPVINFQFKSYWLAISLKL